MSVVKRKALKPKRPPTDAELLRQAKAAATRHQRKAAR